MDVNPDFRSTAPHFLQTMTAMAGATYSLAGSTITPRDELQAKHITLQWRHSFADAFA
ncbi:MAG: hypothetical protein M3R10_06975 [Verrucomicrobiota bacterium]|nr:hypothetical protein [Verrucomicrobiota bacterium]